MLRFLLFILLSATVFAQTAHVSGLITDRETGEALSAVTVRIEGTRLGAITDIKGRFRINNVNDGTIILAASRVGYKPEKTTILVAKGVSEDVVLTMLAQPLRSNDVVVSANKRVQAVQDVPISVATISEAELSNRAIVNLDDALRYVSGVAVARDQVNIRGASGFALGVGSRTAVVLDGFSLLSGDNGDIKFDVLPVSDVQSIEVIKGAGSALYGTGALGGVVSMFTKEPTEQLEMNIRTYGGVYTRPRFEQWKYQDNVPVNSGADFRIAKNFGQFSANVSAGIRSDQSYRDYDAQVRGFGYAKLGYAPSDNTHMKLFVFGTAEEKENFIYWRSLQNATLTTIDVNPDERLLTNKVAIAGELTHIISGTTSLVVRPGFFRTNWGSEISGVPVAENQSTAYSWNVEAFITSLLTDHFVITSGVVGRLNWVRSDVYGVNQQTILSGFAQGEYTFNNLILTLGVRADREETGGQDPQLELSPKAGLSYKLSDDFSLRASMGRGFRAPTIAERFATIRYGPFRVRPNTSVKSESSWSSEIGVHYTSTSGSLPFEVDLAVFNNELYDLIEPTFLLTDPTLPIQFQNVTRARIIGAEFTARTMLTSTIGIETGITAMLPRDLIENAALKYRNNILWYSKASWKVFSDIELQLDYRFQNRTERIDDRITLFVADGDARIEAHIVDARLIWNTQPTLGLPLKATLLTRNLTDYYYTEIIGNLAPTRSVLLQLEYKL